MADLEAKCAALLHENQQLKDVIRRQDERAMTMPLPTPLTAKPIPKDAFLAIAAGQVHPCALSACLPAYDCLCLCEFACFPPCLSALRLVWPLPLAPSSKPTTPNFTSLPPSLLFLLPAQCLHGRTAAWNPFAALRRRCDSLILHSALVVVSPLSGSALAQTSDSLCVSACVCACQCPCVCVCVCQCVCACLSNLI